MTASAIYEGRVVHARLTPFVHRLEYKVFSLLIDLDELPHLSRRVRLFSHNRFNLLSLRDRDFGPRDGTPLRPWIERALTAAGIEIDGGPIRLMCFPRVLGYVFNPLSLWFCHRRDGTLAAVLYEVRNTFGDKHGYLLRADGRSAVVTHAFDKTFHVSPFLPLEGRYDCQVRPPAERFAITIRQSGAAGRQLVATQTARRVPLSDRALFSACVRYPAQSYAVIGGIHWEALKLWWKGAKYHRRAPVPPDDVEFVQKGMLS